MVRANWGNIGENVCSYPFTSNPPLITTIVREYDPNNFSPFRFSQLHVTTPIGCGRNNHIMGFTAALYSVARNPSTGVR